MRTLKICTCTFISFTFECLSACFSDSKGRRGSFGYGHDYKSALLDFTHVAGSIAMVPRYAAGVWWTRWYDLNSGDVKQVCVRGWLRGFQLPFPLALAASAGLRLT